MTFEIRLKQKSEDFTVEFIRNEKILYSVEIFEINTKCFLEATHIWMNFHSGNLVYHNLVFFPFGQQLLTI